MLGERRWYDRYEVDLPGVLAGGSVVCQVRVLDISAGGVRVAGDLGRLRQGDQVKLCIRLKTPVKVEAEVRWVKKTSRGYEAGLAFRFQKMDLSHRERLSAFISMIAMGKVSDIYFR